MIKKIDKYHQVADPSYQTYGLLEFSFTWSKTVGLRVFSCTTSSWSFRCQLKKNCLIPFFPNMAVETKGQIL